MSKFPGRNVPAGGQTLSHYCDVIMGAIASPITSLTFVYSTVYSDANQRKHQSSASLAFFVRNSPGTGEVPAQMASNAENVSILWRHHELLIHPKTQTAENIVPHVYTRPAVEGWSMTTTHWLRFRQVDIGAYVHFLQLSKPAIRREYKSSTFNFWTFIIFYHIYF